MDNELHPQLRAVHTRYLGMSDREIVVRAQRGEELASEFLLFKYRNLVRTKIKSFFLVGAEREDLLQVGMIGLWQAIVDFRCDRAISFPAFAKVCIQRHMITAIKTATRHKQQPLNNSLSLGSRGEDGTSERCLEDVITSRDAPDPERIVLETEETHRLHDLLQRMLSDFEWRVLSGYQIGKSYREIAVELCCKTKSVDNALARIKRKVSTVPLSSTSLSDLLTEPQVRQ